MSDLFVSGSTERQVWDSVPTSSTTGAHVVPHADQTHVPAGGLHEGGGATAAGGSQPGCHSGDHRALYLPSQIQESTSFNSDGFIPILDSADSRQMDQNWKSAAECWFWFFIVEITIAPSVVFCDRDPFYACNKRRVFAMHFRIFQWCGGNLNPGSLCWETLRSAMLAKYNNKLSLLISFLFLSIFLFLLLF